MGVQRVDLNERKRRQQEQARGGSRYFIFTYIPRAPASSTPRVGLLQMKANRRLPEKRQVARAVTRQTGLVPAHLLLIELPSHAAYTVIGRAMVAQKGAWCIEL